MDNARSLKTTNKTSAKPGSAGLKLKAARDAARSREDALRKQMDAEKKRFIDRWKATPITDETGGLVNLKEITDTLGKGCWPAGLPENRLFYDSPTFFDDMRRLNDRGRQLHNAHDAAEEAEKKYQDSLQSKAQTSPCGAICTSHGHEGTLCSRQLTARRVCSSHGQRPPLAAAAAG